MTRHFIPPDDRATTAAGILVEAARCWRGARDAGRSVQPSLALALDPYGCAMLAPVLDSLILFYEAALGRPIAVGSAAALSGDECLLLGLVDGSCPRDCLKCGRAAADTFGCALCSARIMLALTIGQPAPTLQ